MCIKTEDVGIEYSLQVCFASQPDFNIVSSSFFPVLLRAFQLRQLLLQKLCESLVSPCKQHDIVSLDCFPSGVLRE